MPIDWTTLTAALLAGLAGGLHCAAMCGGIATGLSSMGPRGDLRYVVDPNVGRILGYVLAGAAAGGLGGGVLAFARETWLANFVRVGVGVVLILVGLRVLGYRLRSTPLAAAGERLWALLRPIQSRLLPARTRLRRLLLGMLWGWIPCGLSTTLLAVAWLQADARNGALTMLAFGLGTLPTMLPLAWSGQRVRHLLARKSGRAAAASFILAAGALTSLSPWLIRMPALAPWLHAVGCLPSAVV